MANGVSADVEVGETLYIGHIAVEVEYKSGRKVRLRVVAPDEMKISHWRNESGESRKTVESST